jgi:hypothetical protein
LRDTIELSVLRRRTRHPLGEELSTGMAECFLSEPRLSNRTAKKKNIILAAKRSKLSTNQSKLRRKTKKAPQETLT